MTAHRLVAVAGAAAAIAVVAVTVHPRLPHPAPVGRSQSMQSTVLVPAGVIPAATRMARAALACPPQRVSRRGCGALDVTRADAFPLRGAVVVLLVAALHSGDATAPVALRVVLARSGAGWRGEVRLP